MKAMGTLTDPLASLFALPESERRERGVLHTPAEIARQPQAWRTTYKGFREISGSLREFLLGHDIKPGTSRELTIVLVGAGSSDHVAHAAEALLRDKWQCEALSVPSTDLLTNMDDVLLPGRKYLFVSLSRSGESPEAIAVLELARRRYPEIPHILVTCNAKSRMANLFREDSCFFPIVLDDSVNDRGLALTSSVTSMLITLQALANIDSLDSYGLIVEQISACAEEFVPHAAALAEQISKAGCSRACFLGDGTLNAVAREAGLKVLELTAGNVMTLAQSHLGLRHGPMSALDESTVIVSYISSDERRRKYERDLLIELERKQLGLARIAIVPTVSSEHLPVDHVLSLNCGTRLTDDQRLPLDVIFAQLLGLFLSIQNGLKPDRPSPKGVINPVVPPFEVY